MRREAVQFGLEDRRVTWLVGGREEGVVRVVGNEGALGGDEGFGGCSLGWCGLWIDILGRVSFSLTGRDAF